RIADELLLHAEDPLLDVAGAVMLLPTDQRSRGKRVELERIRSGRGRSRGQGARKRDRARHVELIAVDRVAAEAHERRIVGHAAVNPRAVILAVKDAITTAHDEARSRSPPGEAETRSEVILIAVNEFPRTCGIAGEDELAIERIAGVKHQVSELVVGLV